MPSCFKGQRDWPGGASGCPSGGVDLSKASAPGATSWQAVIGGKKTTADLSSLKQWAAEEKLGPRDKVLPPGGEWTAAQDTPGLLIPVITGALTVPCEPVDAIFAIGSHTYGGLFGGGSDPNLAFEGVKQQLRRTCRARGCDAVINCQFEYRVAVSSGLIGTNQVVEIFGYGTAVRFR